MYYSKMIQKYELGRFSFQFRLQSWREITKTHYFNYETIGLDI